MNDVLPIRPDAIIDAMNWRYATKVFDRSRKLSEDDRAALLSTLRLSPSSYGLQPWKFLAVDDDHIRRRLGAYVPANKSKIEDCSMLVVLARRKVTTAEHVAEHIQTVREARGASEEDVRPFKEMVTQSTAAKTRDVQDIWNSRQVYVALGCAIATAAMMKIDACPMEGVDPDGFDETLGLAGTDFTTTVAIAFGYRDDNDPYASYSRARRAVSEVIQEF